MAQRKTQRKSSAATVKQAAAEAVADVVREARTPASSRVAAADRLLSDQAKAVMAEHQAPRWTVALHDRVSHVGGVVAFVVTVAVTWTLAVMLAGTAIMLLATRLVTAFPGSVLTEQGVSQEVAVARTDSFVFGWVLPVLFIVLVLALVSGWGLIKALGVLARWTSRCAQGLFAGYGHGPVEDWRQRQAWKVERLSRKAAAVD